MSLNRQRGINRTSISEQLIHDALKIDAQNSEYRADGGSRIAANAQYDTEVAARIGQSQQRAQGHVHGSSRINNEIRNFQMSLPEAQQGLRRNPIAYYESGVRVQRLHQWYHPNTDPEQVISNRGG